MAATIQQVYHPSYSKTGNTISLWKRFMDWTGSQENNRMVWTVVSIAGHGCIFTIITLMAVITTGNHFIFWPFAIAAIAMTVVTNLAALPTKITIPVFFFSLLIDLVIITSCVAIAIA
jgi:hypothetical protein